MNTEKQQNSQIKRSTSSASSPSQYGAAIGTSCHPPLPIYPDEEPSSPKIEKNVDGLERYSTEGSERGVEGPRIDVPLTKRKKHILLGLFCLGVFMDVLCVCAFYILLGPVASDLDIDFTQQTWIVTSFGLTFASFLLFWGRFADLFSPKPVFWCSFLIFGLLNLIVSFLNDKYSFLILRALAGVSAAALVPASYRLITAVFDKHELPRAFTVFSLSGSLAGASGVIVGGVVMLIPDGGQMAPWRWFFRIAAFIVIPTAIWSIWYIPTPKGNFGKEKGKWKRLDIPGTLLILCAILFFILSLTMGASYGWSDAKFIAPLVISVCLFPSFFFWESRIPPQDALVPPFTWKATNFTLWVILSMFGYAWWTCNQIPMIEVFVYEQGDEPIVAAARLIPSGAFSIMSSFILIKYPRFTTRPRLGFTLGQLGGMLGYGLFILTDGKTGNHYFKFYLPGLAIGSFFNNISCTCVMVGAMTAAPPESAGVVGGLMQAAIQAGNVIALTIQAGLLTIHPGGIADFRNVTASFAFMIGWGGACLLAFWIFYRPPAERKEDGEAAVAMH